MASDASYGPKKGSKITFFIWAVLLPLGWWVGVVKEETTLLNNGHRPGRRFACLWRLLATRRPMPTAQKEPRRTTTREKRNRNTKQAPFHIFFLRHFFFLTFQQAFSFFSLLLLYPSAATWPDDVPRQTVCQIANNERTQQCHMHAMLKNNIIFFLHLIWLVVVKSDAKESTALGAGGALAWNTFLTE